MLFFACEGPAPRHPWPRVAYSNAGWVRRDVRLQRSGPPQVMVEVTQVTGGGRGMACDPGAHELQKSIREGMG